MGCSHVDRAGRQESDLLENSNMSGMEWWKGSIEVEIFS